MYRLVVNLKVLQALKSLVGSIGLLKRDLNFAQGGTGRRRAVHELNLANGADASFFLVLVEFCEVVLSTRKKGVSKAIEGISSKRKSTSRWPFSEISSVIHKLHVTGVTMTSKQSSERQQLPSPDPRPPSTVDRKQ